MPSTFTTTTCRPGLIEELKAHGKAVGTEVGSTPEGLNTVTIGGGPSFVVPPPLMDVEKRLENMDKGKVAMATLEPHTACLGYRLNPEQGERRGATCTTRA